MPRRCPLPSRPSAHAARVLAEHAGCMRHAPTASEAQLFEALRGGALGVSFRRQVPLLGRYIADLFAPEVGLVVEVDGAYHAERAKADARRDRALARAGYVVIRVAAAHVMSDLPAIVEAIREAVARLRGLT